MKLQDSNKYYHIHIVIECHPRSRLGDLGIPLLLAGLLQEAHDRFDAQIEVLQVELFVGGVDVVVGQAEAHHDAGDAEMAVKVADDGDGAAGADEDRLLAPNLFQRPRGRLDVGVVDGNQAGVAGVNQAHFDIDAGGGDLLHIGFVEGKGAGRGHAGNQAHGDLGEGFGGDDRLGAGADEAAGDAVHVEGGPRPGALQNAEADLADQRARADLGDAILLLVEGQAVPCGQLLGAGRNDVVVEAGDEDVAVLVLEAGEHLRQGDEGIGRRATVHSRVQIGAGAAHLQLGVDHAAQADAEGRQAGGK